jgi:hypothetical protein
MLARTLVALVLVIGMDLAAPAGTIIETDRSGAVWAIHASSGRVLPSLVATPLAARSTAAFRAEAAQLLSSAEPRADVALRDEGR